MKLLRLGLRVLGLALTIALVNPGTAETQSRQSPQPPTDVLPERHIASIPGISSKRRSNGTSSKSQSGGRRASQEADHHQTVHLCLTAMPAPLSDRTH